MNSEGIEDYVRRKMIKTLKKKKNQGKKEEAQEDVHGVHPA